MLAAALALAAAAGAAGSRGHPAAAALCAAALSVTVTVQGRRVGRAFRAAVRDQARLSSLVAERTAELEQRTRDLAETVRRLEAARTHLGVADRLSAVGRLASGLAHEINNPLSVTLTSLAWLREPAASGATAEERAAALAEAEEGVQRVARIVRDLQDFAQDRGAAEPGAGAADVVAVLHHVQRLVAHEVRPRARLTLDLPDGALPVGGGAARLGQLFAHLVLHAAHSIDPGRAEQEEVRVTARAEPTGAVVEVRDTGRGLSGEALAHVFDPFYAAWSGDGHRGLGLGVCHGLALALGGSIEAESTPGAGSLYRVRLPAATGQTRVALHAGGSRRPRVLLVDDEPLVCASLYRVLSRHFDVAPHTSALHALQLLRAGERFDAVLCDLMMPEMTGMAFYEELTRLSPPQAEVTIFLTGGAFTESARDFLARVPNPHLTKPFEPAEVVALVRARAGGPEARA
jgi:signal transduction histidine kinase